MAKRKIVCSFDYEYDRKYYNLLEAWNTNPYIDFRVEDCTPSEIQSCSISTIKQVLSRKIGEANYMIAIIGKHSNDIHPDTAYIGYRNWQSYEIAKNHDIGNKLVCVRLDPSYRIPDIIFDVEAIIINGFSLDAINTALKKLSR